MTSLVLSRLVAISITSWGHPRHRRAKTARRRRNCRSSWRAGPVKGEAAQRAAEPTLDGLEHHVHRMASALGRQNLAGCCSEELAIRAPTVTPLLVPVKSGSREGAVATWNNLTSLRAPARPPKIWALVTPVSRLL